ncbi:hypothetical protein KY343_02645 [Candidatus Woesearchaeota archaeon]|nr:hypothetical protein [Candidatus Woesearchaeota archaeon]
MNCIVCLKRLEKGEHELCSTCYDYFAFVYRKEPEEKEEVLELLRKC